MSFLVGSTLHDRHCGVFVGIFIDVEAGGHLIDMYGGPRENGLD